MGIKLSELVSEAQKEEKANVLNKLLNKEHSGCLNIRMSPETHRTLAIGANENGVSLNRFVTSILILYKHSGDKNDG
jgi:predicted HicB family RNase H-like nuclease